MLAIPERGNWIGGLAVFAAFTMLASAGSIMLIIVQAVLFLRRGRTLGMAVTGLVAGTGRRGLSLVADPLMLAITVLVQFRLVLGLRDTSVLGDTAASVLQALACLVAPALNLVFLVGSRRRTLTDLISGLHVVRDPVLPELQKSLRRGPNLIDWLVAICVGAPMVLGLGQPSMVGPDLGSLGALLALGALELTLWRRTGTTLGMRALAARSVASIGFVSEPPLPRTPS